MAIAFPPPDFTYHDITVVCTSSHRCRTMRTRCGRAAARGLRVRGAAAPARSSLVPRHASRRPERLRTALARRDAYCIDATDHFLGPRDARGAPHPRSRFLVTWSVSDHMPHALRTAPLSATAVVPHRLACAVAVTWLRYPPSFLFPNPGFAVGCPDLVRVYLSLLPILFMSFSYYY